MPKSIEANLQNSGQKPAAENRDNGEMSPPNLLDIVKIDGRWAQYSGGNLFKFLDDESVEEIELDDFRLAKEYGKASVVSEVKKQEKFTPEELSHIHWGSEQDQYPHLREQVRVFGEYERKNK